MPVYYPGVIAPSDAVLLVVRSGAEERGIDIRIGSDQSVAVTFSIDGAISREALEVRTRAVVRRRLSDFDETRIFIPESFGALRYRFGLPGPGEYDLFVQASFDSGEDAVFWGRASVSVGGEDIELGNVPLLPYVPFSGRIVTTELVGPGVDLDEISVTLDAQTRYPSIPQVVRTSTISEAGDFSFPSGVSGGVYDFIISGLPRGMYVQAARYRNQNALEGVEVNPGSASALELYLSAGGGIVEGITRTADRQPLPNSIVVLASPGTAPSRLTPLQVAVTDQNGVFVMESIPPGRYQLYAWQRLRNHEYFSSDFLSRYETQAIRIDVGDGSRSVIDVTPFPLR
jgi:hypothetical protein